MQRFCRQLTLFLLALLLMSCGTADTSAPPTDITMTEQGCTITSFALPPTREPRIEISNQAAEPMVFTLPVMNRWQVIAPGQRADFELPRYIMGNFNFFCLTEAAHISIGGGNPFLCSMEPKDLKPVALSSGMFEIMPHNRIQEIMNRPTPAPQP